MPTQTSMRKSASSKRNFLPYLRSASSRLNISALGSTGSLTALFASATQDLREAGGTGLPAKQGSFVNGLRSFVGGKDKENEGSTMNVKRKEKGKKNAYPEISAPTLTNEALEAVKARFTLIPINKSHIDATEDVDEGFSIIREESLVHIEIDSL